MRLYDVKWLFWVRQLATLDDPFPPTLLCTKRRHPPALHFCRRHRHLRRHHCHHHQPSTIFGATAKATITTDPLPPPPPPQLQPPLPPMRYLRFRHLNRNLPCHICYTATACTINRHPPSRVYPLPFAHSTRDRNLQYHTCYIATACTTQPRLPSSVCTLPLLFTPTIHLPSLLLFPISAHHFCHTPLSPFHGKNDGERIHPSKWLHF